QDPTAPGFLVSIDSSARTLTVRRVSATPEPGRSYQLWLLPPDGTQISMGIVGTEEFTTRQIPSSLGNDTLRASRYVISLEQAGGSPTGTISGPVLFTGRVIQTVPGAASN